VAKDLEPEPALGWNGVFKSDSYSPRPFGLVDLQDRFASWHDVGAFFKELRTGVPPLLSFMELSEYVLTRKLVVTTSWLTRVSIIAAFLITTFLFCRSQGIVIFKILISCIFIFAFAVIDRIGPSYDIFWPLCTLLYFVFQELGLRTDRLAGRFWFLFMSGLFLSWSELTRPFMIYLLPLFVVSTALRLWWAGQWAGGREFLVFLLPIVAFSGLWHAKLFIFERGQISWSNHSGCELALGWRGASRELQFKEWMDFQRHEMNLPKVYEACQRRSAKVIRYMFSHPWDSSKWILRKWVGFHRVKITWEGVRAEDVKCDVCLNTYKWTAQLLLVFFLYQTARLMVFCFKEQSVAILASPENMLILTVAASGLVFALVNPLEQARYQLSLAPFLATLPVARRAPSQGPRIT